MARLGPRTKKCTPATRSGRLAKAAHFLEAASSVEQHLDALLGLKTKAGYSEQPSSRNDRKRAARAAEVLVVAAREV